jgi:peptidoglycan/LPS O-acetylase OafA/YrhL
MKKTIVSFIVSALVLVSLAIWALKGKISGNTQEILMTVGVLIMVGFALFISAKRVRSHRRQEPAEDELSKQVMNRAASLSYYISLYWWLLVMYFSDRVSLPVHSLIGAGILGMAIIFVFSWIWTKVSGTKNE